MKEYDRFEKGAVNSNTSTKILQKQMEDDNAKIIIVIQKLNKFISKNKEHGVYKKHIVIIFDECHRSHFGDMHKSITKQFRDYNIFGFTGTPIFTSNANSSNATNMRTTAQLFGGEPDENGNRIRLLHTYTIVDAIHDGNVLPFRIDYIKTIKNSETLYDNQVREIDCEKALLDPKRGYKITQYILEHLEQKTYRNQSRPYYDHKVTTNAGEMAKSKNNTVPEQKTTAKLNEFNSIFAVASIPSAIAYYNEFKK